MKGDFKITMPDSYTDMDDTETGYRGGYGPALTEISKDSNVSIIQLNRVANGKRIAACSLTYTQERLLTMWCVRTAILSSLLIRKNI